MANKLKRLKVTKVDFVDEGANPDAHIRLFKRKDEKNSAEEPETKKIGILRKFMSFMTDLMALDEEITQDDLKKAKEDAEMKGTETDEDVTPKGDTSESDDSATDTKSIEKGEETEMKIDKSKMTPEELKTLEELEKKYGVEKSDEDPDDVTDDDTASEGEDTSLDDEAADTVISDENDDVEKSIHPDVQAQLDELKKFKEAVEDKELFEVAKKYEIIGKKPDELVKKFKSIKAAGGTAYDDFISVLDESVELVEKSGLFNEIGKSGHGPDSGSAEATARTKAVELMKTRKDLTMSQAIDEVLQADPELRQRFEEED